MMADEHSGTRVQLAPSADFERFAPTTPILSSLPLGWPHLLVRTYSEPRNIDRIVVPATPDPSSPCAFAAIARSRVGMATGRGARRISRRHACSSDPQANRRS
jgi:hypothetical protein